MSAWPVLVYAAKALTSVALVILALALFAYLRDQIRYRSRRDVSPRELDAILRRVARESGEEAEK